MCRFVAVQAIVAFLLFGVAACAPAATNLPIPDVSDEQAGVEATTTPLSAAAEEAGGARAAQAAGDPGDGAPFVYGVRVVNELEQPIPDARVLIEIGGKEPLGAFTNGDGYVQVDVPPSHVAQPGRILVEAAGYTPFRQEIDLYGDRLPQMVRLEALGTTTVESAPPEQAAAPDLFVLTEDSRFVTWYISGPAVADFETGDYLIVYGEVIRGVEIAIAQLRVIAKNPTSLLAQTVLINPAHQVRAGLRVDGNLDMLAASELVPAPDFAIGYLLEPGLIRLRPNSRVTPGMLIQAYEDQKVGQRISDYLPFTPPLIMRVTELGVSGVIASVALEEGQVWPQAGTLVSDQGIAPTPTPTSTETPIPPTATPSPTPPPPTATAAPVACAIPVDPELALYWVQAEMGCALAGSTITWASYTPYQTGLMLWRRDTNRAYGFFDSGAWLSVADVWDGHSPTPSRGSPPPGYKEPIRGTGYVWGTDDRFFHGLGWAADDQKGFCAKVQSFEQGFILLSSTVSSCHEENLFNHAAQGGFGLHFLKAHNAGYWRR